MFTIRKQLNSWRKQEEAEGNWYDYWRIGRCRYIQNTEDLEPLDLLIEKGIFKLDLLRTDEEGKFL